MVIDAIELDGEKVDIELRKTYVVTEGVTCSEYAIVGEISRDLAIVGIRPGCKTQPQLIKEGNVTIEGIVAGHGKLFVRKSNGEVGIYKFSGERTAVTHSEGRYGIGSFSVDLERGDVLQWIADSTDNMLWFYEICDPPFTADRFQVLSEDDPRNFLFAEA